MEQAFHHRRDENTGGKKELTLLVSSEVFGQEAILELLVTGVDSKKIARASSITPQSLLVRHGEYSGQSGMGFCFLSRVSQSTTYPLDSVTQPLPDCAVHLSLLIYSFTHLQTVH